MTNTNQPTTTKPTATKAPESRAAAVPQFDGSQQTEVLRPGAPSPEQVQGYTIQPHQALAEADAATTVLVRTVQAELMALIQLARMNPRRPEIARSAILQECATVGRRVKLEWKLTFGRKRNEETGAWEPNEVSGANIRLAEICQRHWRNLYVRQAIVADDKMSRTVRVQVIDLEAPNFYAQDVRVSKLLERSYVREGQSVVRERVNSDGKKVYTVIASEMEVNREIEAQVARVKRNLIFQAVPYDLREEGVKVGARAMREAAQADLPGMRAELMARALAAGIPAQELEAYAGKPLGQWTADDLDRSAEAIAAVESGMRWADVQGAAAEAEDAGQERADSDDVKVKAEAREAKPHRERLSDIRAAVQQRPAAVQQRPSATSEGASSEGASSEGAANDAADGDERTSDDAPDARVPSRTTSGPAASRRGSAGRSSLASARTGKNPAPERAGTPPLHEDTQPRSGSILGPFPARGGQESEAMSEEGAAGILAALQRLCEERGARGARVRDLTNAALDRAEVMRVGAMPEDALRSLWAEVQREIGRTDGGER